MPTSCATSPSSAFPGAEPGKTDAEHGDLTDADFLVIGGGIAGVSAAYELAPHGRVHLLEAEPHLGFHATGRSAAVFTEAYGPPVVRGLAMAGRAFLERPPAGFADVPLLLPRGLIFIGRSDQRVRLDAYHEASAALVPSIEAHDAAFARERVPALAADYVDACVWEPGAMDIDVDALLQGYARAARARGARFERSARVDAIERPGRGDWRVRAGDRVWRAPIVINAAGAWVDEVAARSGLAALGFEARRRSVITFDPRRDDAWRDWPIVIDVDVEFYFKPEAARILASPGDETPSAPTDAEADDLAVALAAERVQRATDLRIEHLDGRWAGLRTFAPDGDPVVGEDPRADGFWWCAGQGGYGIKISPAVARVVAAQVRGEPLPADVRERGVDAAALSPGRFLDDPLRASGS